MSKRFEFLFKPFKGHKFYRDTENDGRVCVVDDSGPDPSSCDHEVLWIDTARRIVAKANSITIPVVNAAGETFVTPCDFTEAAWVAANLGLEIEDAFRVYTLQGTEKPVSPAILESRKGRSNTWSY